MYTILLLNLIDLFLINDNHLMIYVKLKMKVNRRLKEFQIEPHYT